MATVRVPSTALTIQIAKASLVYAGRDIRKKALIPNVINVNLEEQLWVASEVLDWTNTNMPSASNLKVMRNYTLALCGAYIVEASSNVGTGGIVITPTNAAPMGFEGYRNDFTIGVAGSPMVAGDLSLTINLNGFIRNTVMMFPSGINLTIDDPDSSAFQISSIIYNANFVTIQLDYPVADGQRYIVTGLRYGATVTPPSGGGVELPTQDGHEGEVLFTDGSGNLYWADTHIEYTSADFQLDGVTVTDVRLDHNNFDLFWNEANRYLIDEEPDVEFTRIVGGGFIINILGWDANTQDYHLYAELKGLNSV